MLNDQADFSSGRDRSEMARPLCLNYKCERDVTESGPAVSRFLITVLK